MEHRAVNITISLPIPVLDAIDKAVAQLGTRARRSHWLRDAALARLGQPELHPALTRSRPATEAEIDALLREANGDNDAPQ